MLKRIKCSSVKKFVTVKANSQFFLFLLLNEGASFYTKIPCGLFLKWSRETNNLHVQSNSKTSGNYSEFIAVLSRLSSVVKNTFKVKLRLKGLGYRVLSNEFGCLELKLGYSHFCKVAVPNNMQIRVSKTSLAFESSNKVLLGNFTRQIFLLKKFDVYKGKGFSYKYKSVLRKTIKKK